MTSETPIAGAETSGKNEKRLARSAARLAAVQALYQMEMSDQSWREVLREFETHRLGNEIEGAQYREANRLLFKDLLEKSVAHQSEIDKITDEALVASWPLEKVDPVLRAIFRCGGCELLTMEKTPVRVVITEYVDVAKAFFLEGDRSRFVNGVLDSMARVMRPGALEPR